jgi:hypothetical protein
MRERSINELEKSIHNLYLYIGRTNEFCRFCVLRYLFFYFVLFFLQRTCITRFGNRDVNCGRVTRSEGKINAGRWNVVGIQYTRTPAQENVFR